MGAQSPSTRTTMTYRRILFKISGEALMGNASYGLTLETLQSLAHEIKDVHSQSIDVCLVIGGGNIFRGLRGVEQGLDRSSADAMGMLATVINALALQHALESQGLPVTVMSALAMPTVCEFFNHRRALHHLKNKHILLFAAGAGHPYFTTDTAAVLRACEMKCDLLVKGTQVNGVYSADPRKDSKAVLYPTLTYQRALAENLKVMDATALALAQENNIPMRVFSLQEKGALAKVIRGEGVFTHIEDNA